MSAVAPTTLASAAIAAVLELLTDAGLEATADAGALIPDPIGVLVGLPTLTGRGLSSSSYTVPVTIVSADPLSGPAARDRLYGTADAAADAIGVAAYSPSSYLIGGHAEPLASLELVATVSLSRLPEESHATD
jgi:hypothetical protein